MNGRTEKNIEIITSDPKEESFYGRPNDDKSVQNGTERNRQSMTPSEMSDKTMTNTFVLPFKGINTVKELMALKGYEFHSHLGKGGFGSVSKVDKIDPKTGQRQGMACKEIRISQTKRDRMIRSLKCEIFVMRKARHPFIIRLYDHFIVQTATESTAYLFMEFANCGNLQTEISQWPLTNEMAKRYFAQIVMALIYLHRLKIAHKDLKLENILLIKNEKTNQKEVRVTDFGLSQNVYKAREGVIKSGHFGGTRAYMAPEIIRLEVYREHRKLLELNYDPFRSDMWALGVCLYEMMTKQLPFDSSNLNSMLSNQEKKLWTFPRSVRNTIDPNAQNMITSLLEPNVNTRLDLFGATTHPWVISEIDFRLINETKIEKNYNKT